MPIVWDQTLAVGEAAIDADHQRMIELINALEEAASHPPADNGVSRALDELSRLCHEHFVREEALQRAIGYPDHENHRLGHEMLLKRLDAVISHYEDGCDEVRAGIVRTLGDSLATWLATHIANNDMEFKPYVRGR
jgi:hemerythrin